ncbi:MAG: hypothetical protein K9M56_00100 [Victivallales bacterium]|nr:hypothetical protein [Victivallales bacterium]
MKTMISFSFLIITSIIFCSCNSTDENYSSLHYKPAPPVKIRKFKKPEILYIDKVADNRKDDEKELSYTINADPYILIPLWLWSHSNLNPVLRFSYFQEPLPLIIRGLIYKDVKASEIFKELTVSMDYYNHRKNDAYRLKVILITAKWSRNLTSYGLSYPGTILWAFGLPVSYGKIYFKINVTLYAPNSEKKLASKIISKNLSCTEWIYDQVNYSPPISEFKLAKIFPEVMNDLRKFLIKTLKRQNADNRIN